MNDKITPNDYNLNLRVSNEKEDYKQIRSVNPQHINRNVSNIIDKGFSEIVSHCNDININLHADSWFMPIKIAIVNNENIDTNFLNSISKKIENIGVHQIPNIKSNNQIYNVKDELITFVMVLWILQELLPKLFAIFTKLNLSYAELTNKYFELDLLNARLGLEYSIVSTNMLRKSAEQNLTGDVMGSMIDAGASGISLAYSHAYNQISISKHQAKVAELSKLTDNYGQSKGHIDAIIQQPTHGQQTPENNIEILKNILEEEEEGVKTKINEDVNSHVKTLKENTTNTHADLESTIIINGVHGKDAQKNLDTILTKLDETTAPLVDKSNKQKIDDAIKFAKECTNYDPQERQVINQEFANNASDIKIIIHAKEIYTFINTNDNDTNIKNTIKNKLQDIVTNAEKHKQILDTAHSHANQVLSSARSIDENVYALSRVNEWKRMCADNYVRLGQSLTKIVPSFFNYEAKTTEAEFRLFDAYGQTISRIVDIIARQNNSFTDEIAKFLKELRDGILQQIAVSAQLLARYYGIR